MIGVKGNGGAKRFKKKESLSGKSGSRVESSKLKERKRKDFNTESAEIAEDTEATERERRREMGEAESMAGGVVTG